MVGCLVMICDIFDSNSNYNNDSPYNLGWEGAKTPHTSILTHYLNNYTRGNRAIPSPEEPIPNLENFVSSWPPGQVLVAQDGIV